MASETLPLRVLRISRCFPESADVMAVHRLHRGIDARDIGTAHALALSHHGPAFDRFIVSGMTPFTPEDCETLASNPRKALIRRAPGLVIEMDTRGWPLPDNIDRVYSSAKAQEQLGWSPSWGWEEALAQSDRDDLEVLPFRSRPPYQSE